MLQHDPDFYLKVIGMMQTSKNRLKITVTGNNLQFFLNGKSLGIMTTAEFYKMSVQEIWNLLGVSHEHRKYFAE